MFYVNVNFCRLYQINIFVKASSMEKILQKHDQSKRQTKLLEVFERLFQQLLFCLT